MYSLIVVAATLAFAAAAPAPGLVASGLIAPGLPATLLPRVAIAAPQTTIVRQPIIVEEPTPVLRSVPVPLRAVSYAAPSVLAAPLTTAYASPYATGLINPLATAYGAPLASGLIAPGLISPYATGLSTPLLLKK